MAGACVILAVPHHRPGINGSSAVPPPLSVRPARCRRLCGLLALAPLLAVGGAVAEDGIGGDGSRTQAVYRNAGDPANRGAWSAVMPAGCAGRVTIDPAQPATGTDGPADAGTAVRVDVNLPLPGWCGVVVLMQEGSWGDRPGPALALAGAAALVFRARGANGGERVRIKAAIAPDQPFGDSAALPVDGGWIELSSGWREYRIDARGRDLQRVITPFVVIANDKHNPAGRLSVFFDDIRYEWGG